MGALCFVSVILLGPCLIILGIVRNWARLVIFKSLQHYMASFHSCFFLGFCQVVRHPSTPDLSHMELIM